MIDEYCPDCGAHRVALFRYCLRCGLDFDELDARGDLPGGPYSPPRVPGAAGPAGVSTRSPSETRASGSRRASARRRRVLQSIPVGLAAVLAIAVVGVLAIGARSGATTTAAVDTPAAQAGTAPDPATASASAPPAAAVFAPTGQTTQAVVKRVVDGDTIIVDVDGTEYRVRYIGIDAPALVSLDKPVEFEAKEAAEANRRLVSSATVVLERDHSDTDAYGQLLRNVWVEKGGSLVLVSLELVRDGYARVSPDAADTKYEALLAAAESTARTASVGMWSAPELPLTGSTGTPVETGLPRLVGVEPVAVYGSTPTTLRGGPGIYTWRSVAFADPAVVAQWDVRSSASKACQLDWQLEAASGDQAGRSIAVKRNSRETGQHRQAIAFDEALLMVTTTCPSWTFSLQGAATP